MDKEIAANVKLLIHLKNFSASAQPLEGEAIEDAETDQDPSAESEATRLKSKTQSEEVEIVGTKPLTTIESTIWLWNEPKTKPHPSH